MSNSKTLVFQQSHKRRVFILRHGNDNKTTKTFIKLASVFLHSIEKLNCHVSLNLFMCIFLIHSSCDVVVLY